MPYKRRSFDINIKEQPWWKKLDGKYKSLFMYFFIHQSNIGIWEIDLESFVNEWYSEKEKPFKIEDFDMTEFYVQLNSDGTERADLIRGEKLFWFKPSIRFLHGNNHGKCQFVGNDRFPAIIREIDTYPEVKDWFLDEILGNEGRITVNHKLIDHMIYRGLEKPLRPFVSAIAKAIGYDVDVNKKGRQEKMKDDFGCQCQYCGQVFDPVALQIDHIHPVSRGGKELKWNEIPSCEECNKKKGVKPVFQFMQETGFDWLPGLENKVDVLVKKGVLNYPSDYPNKKEKKRKKVKPISYHEMFEIVSNNAGLTQEAFEKVDGGWVRK